MSKSKFNKKKLIRYFRWTTKVAFLLFFVFPIIYLVGAPDHYVYSAFLGGLNRPFLALPYGQSVCTIWTIAYGQIGPGAWLICPLGGLQTLVTGQVDAAHFLLTAVALLLFLVPIFLLGNFFCGWICPLGSIVDGFDGFIARFLRKVEVKREGRLRRSKDKAAKTRNMSGAVACPSCPFSRLLSNRFGGAAANGIIVTSLAGSAIFKFPVFCTVCPIGITTRGMFNLKAWTYLTGTMMPIILELSAIPLIAVLASLREKRYWCRKICPVGATLNMAGSFSPLVKPKVSLDRCVMNECPKNCEDYKLDYCAACRLTDDKKCERVCPQGINLLEGDSLAKCTKCMECYIECDKGAVTIEVKGKSEAIASLKGFFSRRRKPFQSKSNPNNQRD